MSREIRFRDWDEEFGQYITWDMLTSKGDVDTPLRALSSGTFEQYTGLDDANGMQIYEGDVVQPVRPWKNYDGTAHYTNVGDPFVVEHGNYVYGKWVAREIIAQGFGVSDYAPGEEIIIIGTIHENPELLE